MHYQIKTKRTMREIKFRGKRVDNGEFITGSLTRVIEKNNSFSFFIMVDSHWENLKKNTFEVLPETVGQYTGLKDANGVEIYEGDIVEFDIKEWGGNDNIHIVSWNQKDAEWSWGGGSTDDMNYRTIIGNIHDNQELLNA